MNHITQKLIEINGSPVDIKARLEKDKWCVIVFTPSFSIRSSKLHLPYARGAFITALLAALHPASRDANDEELFEKGFKAIKETLELVTGGFNVPPEH